MKVSPRLSLLFDEQVYKEPGSDYFVDLGPSMRITMGRYYAKPWVSVDPWHDNDMKFFLGLGVKY